MQPPRVVDDVTDSSEEQPPVVPRRGLKRKPSTTPRVRRLASDDDIKIQLVLHKKCTAGCTKRCKEQFLAKPSLEEFRVFRKTWKGYHKTDQDTIVTLSCAWQYLNVCMAFKKTHQDFWRFVWYQGLFYICL